MISWGSINAAARNGVSFVAGAGAFATAMHFMSADQVQNVISGLNDIMGGAGKVVAGLAPLAGAVSAWYAARAASTKSQAQTVLSTPAGQQLVAQQVVNNPQAMKAVAQQVANSPDGLSAIADANQAIRKIETEDSVLANLAPSVKVVPASG